ncbi:MAG: lipopolysaccharide heptosyltransferase II [Gammaproteobacteria bacterium]|nr:MAG: lipopolysaccharide heptosyltransferase II [Gammaproteobacteria bacterium]
MKIKSMRLLDRWVGSPMSAALTLVRRIEDRIRAMPTEPPQRILFVKLVEQGATVIAEPALRLAVEMVGRENVFMVVFRQNRFILDVLEVIPEENVITIRSSELTGFAIDTVRAIFRMRREKIDAAIDFEFFSRFSATLTYLSGAKRRVGFHSFAGEAAYRGDLMTHKLAYNYTLHAGQTYRVLVEALGFPRDQMPMIDLLPDDDASIPEFTPGPGEIPQVKDILRNALGQDTIPPLILLNANSGDLLPLRTWALDRYVELAKRLLERYADIAIAFTGSPDEAEDAQKLADLVGSPRCFSMGGKTSLRQLFVLYGIAEIMVTNDSGPAHYASMTPIDVVTLFGPESPVVFGSKSPRSHIVYAGIACSPCVNAFNQRISTCTNNVCMQRITVDQVFDTVCREYDRRCGDQAPPLQAGSATAAV